MDVLVNDVTRKLLRFFLFLHGMEFADQCAHMLLRIFVFRVFIINGQCGHPKERQRLCEALSEGSFEWIKRCHV